MQIVYVVVSALIALVAVMSAVMKLKRDPKVMESINKVEFPSDKVPVLAALEIAGALGVVAGFVVKPLGVAAAVGLVLYFLGAAGSHVRVGDKQGIPAPMGLAVLAAIATALTVSQL
jgi:uncharacterized membrane protein YphA (DoxX/SURF4 family)